MIELSRPRMGAISCHDALPPFHRAIYHVYCQVARGELIFDDHDEAAELIQHLRTVRELDG
jgi:hypothetical protein